MNRLKLSLVIPAYNEEQNIRATVSELQETLREQRIPYEIIVVNDNSVDGTPQEVASLAAVDSCVRTVDRTPPGGFGRAIRSGLEAVDGDVVVIYMADRSDDPSDAVRYYRKICEGYDCVFGSRFIRGSRVSNYPPLKLIVNRIVNKAIQWLFWTSHNDLTNAFKAYRTQVIRECGPYHASHFNITIEMSLNALIRDYSIATVPISWEGRKWGSSNLRLREMGRRYLSTLLELFFKKILIRDDLSADALALRQFGRDNVAQLSQEVRRLEARIAALERARESSSKAA